MFNAGPLLPLSQVGTPYVVRVAELPGFHAVCEVLDASLSYSNTTNPIMYLNC